MTAVEHTIVDLGTGLWHWRCSCGASHATTTRRKHAGMVMDEHADLLAEVERLRVFVQRIADGDVRHAVVEARRVLGQPLIDREDES